MCNYVELATKLRVERLEREQREAEAKAREDERLAQRKREMEKLANRKHLELLEELKQFNHYRIRNETLTSAIKVETSHDHFITKEEELVCLSLGGTRVMQIYYDTKDEFYRLYGGRIDSYGNNKMLYDDKYAGLDLLMREVAKKVSEL